MPLMLQEKVTQAAYKNQCMCGQCMNEHKRFEKYLQRLHKVVHNTYERHRGWHGHERGSYTPTLYTMVLRGCCRLWWEDEGEHPIILLFSLRLLLLLCLFSFSLWLWRILWLFGWFMVAHGGGLGSSLRSWSWRALWMA